MVESIQVLWTPAGENLPSLGARALVDVSDGDTPNMRLPIRMLSIDTPEVTARTVERAKILDEKFSDVARWMEDGNAPVSDNFANYILPKLKTGSAATLQLEQGKSASAWFKERVKVRLERPGKKPRKLFTRTSQAPFDNYNRLLAYISPSYSKKERKTMSRKERATFNMDLVESGWAMPFILFPNIPGELDLPLYLKIATAAADEKRGQYQNSLFLPGWEYRMMEKLVGIKKKVDNNAKLSFPDLIKWRSRYAMDMRNRILYGPEDYMQIPVQYRIWLWRDDVQLAIGKLNLIPAQDLVI